MNPDIDLLLDERMVDSIIRDPLVILLDCGGRHHTGRF